MIPTPEQRRAIANQRLGDLADVPFAVLIEALASAERTVELEIERKPLVKTIVFEHGVPVDCRSNLLRETFGQFLVEKGCLTAEEQLQYQAESATSGLPLGEILIKHERLRASEVFRALQENLAKKLLDGFTWRVGKFTIRELEQGVDSPLKVKVPQLVVTGIIKLAWQEEVDQALNDLVGKRLIFHPQAPYNLADIRLTDAQRAVARMLHAGKRLDELAAEATLQFSEVARLVYALAVLGVVIAEDAPLPAPEPDKPDTRPIPRVSRVLQLPPDAGETRALREDVHAAFLRYRTQDAFELLGLEENANHIEIEDAFLERARRFAPWRFTGELEPLYEKAEALFLACGRAFGELCDVEQRNALIQRRRQRQAERPKKGAADRFAIQSELLDSASQFKRGKALVEENRFREAIEFLAFAHDLDPQNTLYRAELAFCRYRADSRAASQAIEALTETIRIDPKFGLARYYAGVIQGETGQLEAAEGELRRAIKLMSPDRRPIEALKTLVGSATWG